MDTLIIIYSYNGIFLSNKMERITNTLNNMDESQKYSKLKRFSRILTSLISSS